MATDAYVQIAVDGVGKKMATDQQTDAGGNTVHVQKTILTGDPADAILQLLEINVQQLSVLRALLRVLTDTSNSRTQEEDFSSQRGSNFDV